MKITKWRYASCVRDSFSNGSRARVIPPDMYELVDKRIWYLNHAKFLLLQRACRILRMPAEDVLDLAESLFNPNLGGSDGEGRSDCCA